MIIISSLTTSSNFDGFIEIYVIFLLLSSRSGADSFLLPLPTKDDQRTEIKVNSATKDGINCPVFLSGPWDKSMWLPLISFSITTIDKIVGKDWGTNDHRLCPELFGLSGSMLMSFNNLLYASDVVLGRNIANNPINKQSTELSTAKMETALMNLTSWGL